MALFFITGTGTCVGKTFVTRGIAAALRQAGKKVAALKPIETGCAPEPEDAIALARACGDLSLVSIEGFYRQSPALSPYAISLEDGVASPDLTAIAETIRGRSANYDATLVEGAGGLLTPLTRDETIAELAQRLDGPVLLVAKDELGVQSFVLTAAECAATRGLRLCGLVLVRHASDSSQRSNATILEKRLGLPVFIFPAAANDDGALAGAACSCGVMELFTRTLA